MPSEQAVKKPSLYPGKFVYEDGKPLKEVWVYTDIPGDNKFALDNRWQTNERGVAGKLLESQKYNFFFSAEKREKSWLEQNLREEHCKLVETGKPQDGVIEIKLKRPTFEVLINMSADPAAQYLGWSASKCQLKQKDGDPVFDVQLRCKAGSVGKLSFFDDAKGAGAKDTRSVQLGAYQAPTTFYLGGKFGQPSLKDKDTELEVVYNGEVVLSCPLMVRIRKNANTLSDDERKAFVKAMGDLNDNGNGPFQPFRAMHTDESDPQAHGGVHFLCWHRAYILDLERELQKLDPAVSLHYWRFDQPAPNLFTKAFIGETPKGKDRPEFNADNELKSWKTDTDTGILRKPLFDTATEKPKGNGFWPPKGLLTQDQTIALGGGDYKRFAHPGQGGMEGNPHGAAHVSFEGYIDDIGTAAKDPLFFMLHCNVDRLFAEWQKRYDKYKDADFSGAFTGTTRMGQRWDDTMWPWDQDSGNNRPSTAPGGDFPDSPTVQHPGKTPKVKDVVDYQGKETAGAQRLGFDYDTVPFV